MPVWIAESEIRDNSVYCVAHVLQLLHNLCARVAELVDALDLGSSSGDRVGVQVSPLAPV